MSLAELPGSWSVVEGHGEAYARTAKAIEQAIVHLQAIRDEDQTVAPAFDRVRETADEVSAQIDRAASRYATTGMALVDYAEALREAQAQAADAIERWDAADARLEGAAAEHDRLTVLAAAGGDGASAALAEADVQQAVVSAQSAARAEAEAAWRAARARRDEAAALAESRIRDELERSSLRDSLWDDVRGAVTDCFDAIDDALVEVLRWLAATVLAAVAVLVAAALALALAAAGLVGLLVGGLVLLVLGTWVASGGAEAFVRTLVATGSLEAALLGGTLAWLIASLPWVVDWFVEGDAGRPELVWHADATPQVRESGTPGERLAMLQAGNRAVDAHAGGPGELPADGATMITVTAVETRTPSGTETVYRVSIPSTQAWLPGTSSLNDIHSDFAAKLGTEPTQLELAVREALETAGVPLGASVLLSGWSLGGITAANLAADPGFAADFDIDAVIVAGASIDDAAVPPHIPVLAFEHSAGDGLFDPVPHTEHPAKPRFDQDAHRLTVRVDPPAGTGLLPHDGLAYQATMQQQGDLPGSPTAAWMALHDLDRYFSGLERAHSSIFVRGD